MCLFSFGFGQLNLHFIYQYDCSITLQFKKLAFITCLYARWLIWASYSNGAKYNSKIYVNISFLDSTAQAHMSALSTNPLGGLISYCIIGPTFLLLDEVWQIRQHGENWGGWGLHCRWELEGNPLDFSFYGMLVMLQCWYNWNCLVCVTVSHRVIVFYRVLGPYGPHLLSLD